ncbi:MAG: DUF6056 family protein, partial [Candidatus Cloacimonadaceae bacterium]|nr:DUF6056 family protein [Candidatus Cloacimonadaceae bacterium]
MKLQYIDKALRRAPVLNVVCVLLLLVSAVIVFRINQNSHLYSDDYLYSFKFNPGFVHADPATLSYEKISGVEDFLGSLSLLYQNLTGRIVPHALLQFFLLLPAWVFDLLNTLALFALTFLMSTWLLGGQRHLRLLWWLLLSILYYLAVFSTIPNLYLPAFSFNYLWTSLIVFIFLIPVRRYISAPGASSGKIGFAFLMLLGGLIAGDTNEPVIPALLMAMGALGLWRLYRDRSLPLWYLFAGVGAALGFAFMFFAPGNTQRALYETQNAGSRGIGFGLGNLKAILFSSVTTFPAVLMALIGLVGMKRRPDPASIPPFVFMLLMCGGTVFALLFSPLYIARMNILFVGFLLILLLQIFSRSKFHSATWLFACILVLAPFYALKLSADFHRMDRANQEYALFRQQIAEC